MDNVGQYFQINEDSEFIYEDCIICGEPITKLNLLYLLRDEDKYICFFCKKKVEESVACHEEIF